MPRQGSIRPISSRASFHSVSWCLAQESSAITQGLSRKWCKWRTIESDRIGPVAAFKTAAVVQHLPKTRSGKILRGTLQKIADGEQHNVPVTVDDPTVLSEISVVLENLGYPGRSF